MTEQTQNRYSCIDFLKGLGIFLVVWGHTMTPRSVWLYSFHMPLFFFLSGFVFRAKPLKEFLVNKINRLYVPYFVFTVLSWVFYLLVILFSGDMGLLRDHLPKIASAYTGMARNGGNDSIWFLPCLMMVSGLFFLLKKLCGKNIFIIPVILGFSLLGYRLGEMDWELPFKLDVAFSGLSFYFLGFITRERNLLQNLRRLRPALGAAIAALCLFLQIYCAQMNVALTGIPKVSMFSNNLGNFYLFHLAAWFGIAALAVVGVKADSMGLINYLGKHSLIILASHKPLLFLFQTAARDFVNTQSFFFGLTASLGAVALTVPLIRFSEHYLARLTGSRPFLAVEGVLGGLTGGHFIRKAGNGGAKSK